MNTDYYAILDVEKTATQKEIKSAFRTLAHTHHPDKGGDEQKFKEINQAYQTLSDEKKRAQYDRFGGASGNFGSGHGDFNTQYAQYYTHFTSGSASSQFRTMNLKKIPLVGWLLLIPFIIVIAFIGMIIVFGLAVRTISRSFSR